jgi:hypothetical protein
VVMQEQILALVLTLDHLHLLRPNQVPKWCWLQHLVRQLRVNSIWCNPI